MRSFLFLITCIIACAGAFAQGIIKTIAGDGVTQYIGDGWPATSYSLAAPAGVVVGKNGSVFVADYADSRIRKVANDTLSTIGDTSGTPGYTGDGGIAVNAHFNNPSGLCMDTAGNLFIPEEFNHTVRRIDRITNIVTTVCGSGTGGFMGDGGPATAARMNQPAGACVDKAGNIYVADKGNNRIRKVTFATGIITTVAGDGSAGFMGDGGPATAARLNSPRGVSTDAAGNIYIADYGNSRIRKIDASGTITTIAGFGTAGYSGDGGLAIYSKLRNPNNVFVDKHSNLFISDYGNNVIRKISASGNIYTVAGNGSSGYSGDGGPATAATFYGPTAIFIDDSDYLYIADGGNSVIRKVSPVVTGVNDIVMPALFQVYPNPSTGKFTISGGALHIAVVSIYNTMGRRVFSAALENGQLEVDISSQPAGLYYISIKSPDVSEAAKLVLIR